MIKEPLSKNSSAREGIDLDEVEPQSRQTVLVVDDDPETVILLKHILRAGGFDVLGAFSGEEALNKVVKHDPDLVLLDLMMPDMDGWETFAHMRKMTQVPVIIISAMCAKEEIVDGLKRGADDYISKPFFNPEVVERVRAVLRRSGKEAELSRLVFPKIGLVVDLQNQQMIIENHEIHLTPKEFAFIHLLAKSTPAVVSYDTISNMVFTGSRNVRKRANYLVYLLRRKYEPVVPDLELIINVDRLGYKLRTEP